MKQLLFIFITFAVVIAAGRNLLPINDRMFNFHDLSQPGRIAEFSLNLHQLQIPPRLAPRWSHNMGYPVFNFYAPFAYWVSAFIHSIGFDIADSLKLSFLFAILTGFIGMYLFMRNFYNFFPALMGAALYAASPYLAIEIFVRGNLGEVWFIGLFPLSLYLLQLNSKKNNARLFILCTIIISFLLTSHNLFSLIALSILIIYIYLLENRKRNYLTLLSSLLLSSYFLIPALLETNLTYAREMITQTFYGDHFLCLHQIWNSPWGYAGSTKGCEADGMSFIVGKFHILMGLTGTLLYIYTVIKQKGHRLNNIYLFILSLGFIATYLTTYQSALIWSALYPILSLFQFPWRFLLFTNFFLSFFAAYFMNQKLLQKNSIYWLFFGLIILVLLNYSKYFTRITNTKKEFHERFTSEVYINRVIAYTIPEYLPKTANLENWLQYKPDYQTDNGIRISKDLLASNTGVITPLDKKDVQTIKNNYFEKKVQTNSEKFLINIHYFPFWRIYINDKKYTPQAFDELGRPLVQLKGVHTIMIVYKETTIEMIADIISAITFFTIILISLLKTRSKNLPYV